MPAKGNADLQTLICVLVARPRRCPTLSNPVPWQNWMAAYLGYTLRMTTLFRPWPVVVHDTHTRRRIRYQCCQCLISDVYNGCSLSTTWYKDHLSVTPYARVTYFYEWSVYCIDIADSRFCCMADLLLKLQQIWCRFCRWWQPRRRRLSVVTGALSVDMLVLSFTIATVMELSSWSTV